MGEVKYFAPSSMDEALRQLAEYGEKVTVLAGGTDLLPKINYYELKPEVILFIGGLGLDYIKEENGNLVIGAATTTAKIASSDVIAEKAGALSEAARLSGSAATRTSATIGGNLGTASPAADLVTPLLVMDADLVLKGSSGERLVAVKDFFTGPGETVLKPDELIVEIRVSLPQAPAVFLKLGRRKAMTHSVSSVGVKLDMAGKTCTKARIALGSMAPTPLRCTAAEGLLEGKEVDASLISRCASEAVAESSPIDDQRASAWYRKRAGETLVARALAQAAGVDR